MEDPKEEEIKEALKGILVRNSLAREVLTCGKEAKKLVLCVSDTQCFKDGRRLKDCTDNDFETSVTCKEEIEAFRVCKYPQSETNFA
mmetsp:Transcript_15650/g.28487  ORF Transcript_15650/g.28487 Transcript_15650/m.28487 type:complete len:87 (-) Transcript_15650:14-274(-)